jgi:hypothetical protein
MSSSKQSRYRLLAAWMCLLAVAMLFAPLAGAAWMVRAMSCCTGDHCAIPQHHHRATVDADCDHGSGGGLTNCSMACCQDQDRPFATAMTFVLPPLAVSSAPMSITRATAALRSTEIPRSIRPLLPPPRILPAVAVSL